MATKMNRIILHYCLLLFTSPFRLFPSLPSLPLFPLFLLFSLSASVPIYQAQAGETTPNPNTTPAPKKKANILDFEAEVIEGERKTPDLFIQLSMEQQQTKAVTFSRKNFNSYHTTDSQKRPKYQEK